MPHNVLISKIRCGNPNKKSTAIHNKNSFMYIGTREGTDLTPLEEENTDKFEKEMATSGSMNGTQFRYLFSPLLQDSLAQ